MHIFMPMLKDRFLQLLLDHSVDSVLVQKQIFKILYALFQVMVNVDRGQSGGGDAIPLKCNSWVDGPSVVIS